MRKTSVQLVAGTHDAELEGSSQALASQINDLNMVLWKSPLRGAQSAEFASHPSGH